MSPGNPITASFFILVVLWISAGAGSIPPPLPDPASVVVYEPPVWYEPVKNHVSLSAIAGDFYNLLGDMSWTDLRLTGHWEDKCEWDTINISRLGASYGIPLNHLWLKPAFDMYRYQRNDELLKLDPSMDASSTLPFAVISGNIHSQKWTVNGSDFYEQYGRLEFAFDRLKYVPQLEYSAIRNVFYNKTRLTAQLNVYSLHLSIGSALLHGFPSPSLCIKFLTPSLKIENEINSGDVFRTYESYINFEDPARMYPGLPEESLRASANSRIRYDKEWYNISISGTYNNWYSRIVTAHDFYPALQNDIEEINLNFYGRFRIKGRLAAIDNAIGVQYNWTSRYIPFLPAHAGIDTFAFTYKCTRIFTELKFYNRRNGIVGSLPPAIILNPGFGLEYRQFRVFFTIFNATDRREEIFDGYHIFQRQYAGGLAINLQF